MTSAHVGLDASSIDAGGPFQAPRGPASWEAPSPTARPLWHRRRRQAADFLRRLAAFLAHDLVGPLIEAALPADCPGCEKPLPGINRGGLCASCWGGIRTIESPLCPRCGVPFPVLSRDGGGQDHVCRRCTDHPPAFDGARCGVVFDGPVRVLLHLLKFDHRRDLARHLSRAMLDALPPEERFDLVIAVPLHWTRFVKRGYNQASLLAGFVARAKRTRRARRILFKRRRTADQARLDASRRRINLRGAFGVRRTCRSLIADRSILLVDDVVTTGATVEECARVLKSAGARRVFVLAVARTPLTPTRAASGRARVIREAP